MNIEKDKSSTYDSKIVAKKIPSDEQFYDINICTPSPTNSEESIHKPFKKPKSSNSTNNDNDNTNTNKYKNRFTRWFCICK